MWCSAVGMRGVSWVWCCACLLLCAGGWWRFFALVLCFGSWRSARVCWRNDFGWCIEPTWNQKHIEGDKTFRFYHIAWTTPNLTIGGVGQLTDIMWSSCKLWPLPRNYPVRFGLKLLQLRDLMLRDHAQPPSKRWDFDFDDLLLSLEKVDWTQIWEDAELQSVCHYLRGSTNLKLPPEIRSRIPTVF